jgi:hypothetical protein
LIRQLNNRSVWERYPNLSVWVLGPDSDPISQYTRDPQAVYDSVAAWAITDTALLTLDGQWIEAGTAGQLGAALPAESQVDAYVRLSTAYLDAVDDNCIIVRLLCHC